MQTDHVGGPQAHAAFGFPEFIALIAAIMSTQALAVDAMLPALPRIVDELQVPNPTNAWRATGATWFARASVTGKRRVCH